MKACFKEPEIQVELFSVETIMVGGSINHGADETTIIPLKKATPND